MSWMLKTRVRRAYQVTELKTTKRVTATTWRGQCNINTGQQEGQGWFSTPTLPPFSSVRRMRKKLQQVEQT